MEGMSRFDLIFVEVKCWDTLSVTFAAQLLLKIAFRALDVLMSETSCHLVYTGSLFYLIAIVCHFQPRVCVCVCVCVCARACVCGRARAQ